MLFSIIIPVYQVEKYISAALSSVEAQTFADWEAVIVDDGSTDAGNAICREFCRRDPRFKLIRQDNAGLSAARNTGVTAAAGDYILFLDGDDFLKPDALSRLAAQIELTPVDIVCFNGYINTVELEDGGLAEEWIRGGDLPLGQVFPAFKLYGELVRNCASVVVSAVWLRCYKSSFLKEHALRFVPGRLHEDEEWTPRVFYFASSAVMIDYSGYCYRRRTGSITAAWNEKNIAHLVSDVDDLCRFFSEHGFPDAETARPFLDALMILFSSYAFVSLDRGQRRIYKEQCGKHRIFRAISKLPFYGRASVKARLGVRLAGVALTFPALYHLARAVQHLLGKTTAKR